PGQAGDKNTEQGKGDDQIMRPVDQPFDKECAGENRVAQWGRSRGIDPVENNSRRKKWYVAHNQDARHEVGSRSRRAEMRVDECPDAGECQPSHQDEFDPAELADGKEQGHVNVEGELVCEAPVDVVEIADAKKFLEHG